jgi:hypothetical protein
MSLTKLVEQEVHGEQYVENIAIVESMEDDINIADLSKFPKVHFLSVDPNRRAGDNVRGERIMGVLRTGRLDATLLVPDKYDYKWVDKLKDGEILARVENSLTQVRNSSYDYASLVKLNLKTKTVTFATQRASDGEVEQEWEKPVRAKEIILHLPFNKTVD